METGAFDKDPVPSFDNLYWTSVKQYTDWTKMLAGSFPT